MKKTLIILLAHFSILAMNEPHPPSYEQSCNDNTVPKFDLGSFLRQHKWHERKDALTADQREELGEYLEIRQKERVSTDLANIDLATILMDGLSLIEKKKSPVEADELLHRGILEDSGKKVRRAIRCGANVKKGKQDKHPLVWAVLLNRANAVDALLENDEVATDVKTMGHNNKGLICYAKKTQIALALIRKGSTVLNEVTEFAINSDSPELLKECANHQRYQSKLLPEKIWQRALSKPDMLKIILDSGFDPNRPYLDHPACKTPILLTAINVTRERNGEEYITSTSDALKTIQILLDAGAYVNQPGILQEAIRFDHPAVDLLVERGATL